jgi:hypothetical protein
MKPVELIERALRNSSKTGDRVVDLFGGSGSTMIACEKTGRESSLMELDPKYADVIVNRWQDFTGRQAVHEETGLSFEAEAAEPGTRSCRGVIHGIRDVDQRLCALPQLPAIHRPDGHQARPDPAERQWQD